jgi:hypothetical protein
LFCTRLTLCLRVYNTFVFFKGAVSLPKSIEEELEMPLGLLKETVFSASTLYASAQGGFPVNYQCLRQWQKRTDVESFAFLISFGVIESSTPVFDGNYLVQQGKQASFRYALMTRIPTIGHPEASLAWVATGLFISIPVASSLRINVHEQNWVFWTAFAVAFTFVSVCILTFYAGYNSW